MAPGGEPGASELASGLILNIDPVEREVCSVAGSDHIRGPDGVMKIMTLLTAYPAPDGARLGYQEVPRSW